MPDRIFYKETQPSKRGEEEAYGPPHRISIHMHTYHYMYVLGGPVAKSADISLPHFIIRSSQRYAWCGFEHHTDHTWDKPSSAWVCQVFVPSDTIY